MKRYKIIFEFDPEKAPTSEWDYTYGWRIQSKKGNFTVMITPPTCAKNWDVIHLSIYEGSNCLLACRIDGSFTYQCSIIQSELKASGLMYYKTIK